MDTTNVKPSTNEENGSAQRSEPSKSDRVIHDSEEHGLEENVELVDSEWADFERALRYNANFGQ